MGLGIYEKKNWANHATCLQRPPQNCYSTSRAPCITLYANYKLAEIENVKRGRL